LTEPYDFYGGNFSNFARSPIFVDVGHGMLAYDTVEHAFQAAKTRDREEHEKIRGALGPAFAKQQGRQVQLRPDWEEVKYDVMVECLRAKFALPKFREALLRTGDRQIREDSPTDFVWGYRNNGQNLLGKALMQVRDEIKTEGRT
jgi:hypothetical protein